jgi:hypothetical protein
MLEVDDGFLGLGDALPRPGWWREGEKREVKLFGIWISNHPVERE